jgi:hypothetical protein
MHWDVQPTLVFELDEIVVDPDNIVGVSSKRRPHDGCHADVFSSTWGSTSSGPIVYLCGFSGTIRGSTSK